MVSIGQHQMKYRVLNSVAYGNGTFVAVAWYGGSPDKRIMYSTDGMNWTSIYSPDNINIKDYLCNGKFRTLCI